VQKCNGVEACALVEFGLIFRRMQIAFDAVRGRIGFRVP
jgi:hypothetical protein